MTPGSDAGPRVFLGAGTVAEEPCIVGKPTSDADAVTRIGEGGRIRPFTTIYAGVVAGDRLQTGQGVTIREGNVLGDDVSVGTSTVLECGNRIGNRVRIHTGCFLELVTVEDGAWIGPRVVFTDDLHPPCEDYENCVGGAVVERDARIGANVTVLPGVRIGAGALVGAGSVVTRDVEPGTVVAGNPATFRRRVDELRCHRAFLGHPYVRSDYAKEA